MSAAYDGLKTRWESLDDEKQDLLSEYFDTLESYFEKRQEIGSVKPKRLWIDNQFEGIEETEGWKTARDILEAVNELEVIEKTGRAGWGSEYDISNYFDLAEDFESIINRYNGA